ncbi:hypothetical protein ACEYYH_10670 [Microbacterium trichothecenolyticum]|uniref:hypothetical protein n=1 Tax=Microbacterium trichothecenolyticum TaxID=69370 RepID=UPI0035BE783B
MSGFTASNGIPVTLTADGRLIVENADHTYPATVAAGEHVDALREFFRDERDANLGRWRWPANPEWLVKYIGEHMVVVVHETEFWQSVGRQGTFNQFHFRDARNHGDVLSDKAAAYKRAAWAFFEAHPEHCPKPWTEAKLGEVWVVAAERDGIGEIAAVKVASGHFDILDGRDGGYIRPQDVTSGRRIWPEVAES